MLKDITQEQLQQSLGRIGGVFLTVMVFIGVFLMFITAIAGYILVKLVK